MGRSAAVYEMAAHLLLQEQPFSRNRNYEAFNDPRFSRAIALYRRLRALLSDLERANKDGTRVVVTEDANRVRLDFASDRYARTAFVERPAWNILMMHPRAQSVVKGRAA
jgi:hypothetical protein